MANIHVNPTRMELKKLQARYATARRGHKLLKDKRDELMRQFLQVVKDCKELRTRVEKTLTQAFCGFALSGATMHPLMLEEALLLPKTNVSLSVKEKNHMGVTVPAFTLQMNATGDSLIYGLAFTPMGLDESVQKFSGVAKEMLTLAELEKSASLLSEEIERTRRRVNALEHIMMPQYLTAIKAIKMKLEENERGNITRLMKVKDMMLKSSLQAKYSFFPDEEEEMAE